MDRLAQPRDTLKALQGLVVIDEVQKRPDLFPVLRVLIDRSNAPGQYLLLGSAAPSLLRQASESLLGRVEVIEVTGFNLVEVGPAAQPALWLRGGYPRAFLADSETDGNALYVVYPGLHRYPMGEGVEAVPLWAVLPGA